VFLELAAGVEHGEHDFGRRPAALVHVHWNAAAVVDDRHGVVDMNRDRDVLAETRERFVDELSTTSYTRWCRPGRPGGPDVHGRALPDGFQAFQNLDFVGPVVVCPRRHSRAGSRPGLAVLVQLVV
jgi:hypothetical protein